MSVSMRPTSRSEGKEGRELDRNVLMDLRTGSAESRGRRRARLAGVHRGRSRTFPGFRTQSTPHSERIVGRRHLDGLRRSFASSIR